MASPKEIHDKALAARKQELAALEAKASTVATLRIVAALAAIVFVVGVAFLHLGSAGWAGVLGSVLAFVVLVVVHARIYLAKDKTSGAVRFHENALARMAGKWRTFPSTGERFASPTHAFGGDLDVFGRASLFQRIDATSTRYGEEVLAKWLCNEDVAEDFAAGVKRKQEAVRDLAARIALREELAALGSLLGEAGKPDPRPFVMWAAQKSSGPPLGGILRAVAVVMPILTIGTAILASMGLLHRLAFLVPFVIDVAILNALRGRLRPILEAASSKENALSRYGGMLALLENETFQSPLLESLQGRLKESGESATKEMNALSRIVSFLDARNNEVFRFFIGPMLLWDLWCGIALDQWRARAGRSVFGWFRALAELEALASLAGFAFENPDFAYPDIGAEPTLEATLLGHPLIDGDKRVSNDLSIPGPGHGLVVTGSNMSGKSTLLRAIGINIVLANAGAPVCATKMTLGRLEVATSMRVSDSLEEGTSRFYAELKKLKLVLDLARRATKGAEKKTLVFLLDEILHGTNTRERLIGARAILKELLSLGAEGAVSTHDLGLGELEAELPGKVKNVHFEEQVKGDVMTFDYRLREGIVQSSNALRLMKIVGLDVIDPT